MLHVYHGDGKGKTTSALGLSVRAAGAGKKVRIIFFDKGGWFYNERVILEFLKKHNYDIDYRVFGCERFNPESQQFRFGVTDMDIEEAEKGFELVSEWGPHCDLLILDEINSTATLGMLEWKDILPVLMKISKNAEVVCTGRNPHPELLAHADLITQMVKQKHYFDEGTQARKGIEW